MLKENFNNKILDELYFEPKKIDINIVDTKLNNEDYISKVLNTINYFGDKNVEQMIMNKIKGFEEETSYKINVAINNEVIYIGSSAGSDILGNSIETALGYDDNKVNMSNFTGLKIVNGLIIPHANNKKEFIKQCQTKYSNR